MKEKKNCLNCKKNVCALLSYLSEDLDETYDLCKTICPLLEVQRLDKTTAFAGESVSSKQAFWLQSGYGRYFGIVTNDEGLKEEITIDFCLPGKIFFVKAFIFNEQLIKCNLQFVAGTVIIPIQKKHLVALKPNGLEVAAMAEKLIALERVDSWKRTTILKIKPRERYKAFLRFYSEDITQCFSVKDIANFLGMQPSYLSRLRAEYIRKKTEVINYLQTVFFIVEFV